MWRQTACDAVAKGKCLQVSYDGYSRLVEVHVVGETTAGHDAMRVYQVRGGSNSNERIGWKLLRLDEALGATVTDEVSHAPRPSYNRNDSHMARIYCRV